MILLNGRSLLIRSYSLSDFKLLDKLINDKINGFITAGDHNRNSFRGSPVFNRFSTCKVFKNDASGLKLKQSLHSSIKSL